MPTHGMTLASFKRGGIEVIDQATKEAFESNSKGLGVLIGPHFHRRLPELVPVVDHEEKFPHIAYNKAHGVSDPFSHGVARYAPWQWEQKEQKIIAKLSGKSLWEGVALKDIEGQDFEMRFNVMLDGEGLHIDLSVVSDTDSLVGLHYYYRLPDKEGIVECATSKEQKFPFKLSPETEVDENFHFYPDPLKGEVYLRTKEFDLKVASRCQCQENSWQLYRTKDATFVCIEPISAKDPHHPTLTVSSLAVDIMVYPCSSR
ncbi:MAG: hypothetical protein ACK5MA_07545 [Parachlamydiaceae bacterium]